MNKTEKQKMIDGELYRSFGSELFDERQHAKRILFKFNDMHPDLVDERHQLLRDLFGSAGVQFYIEPPFRCDYGYNIHWGENSYANFNLTILDCAEVYIGKQVLFGPNVSIFTAAHPIDAQLRRADWEFAKTIVIGDGVWIGGGAIINPGVTIGENSVIGAGSVVTRDIPANVVAVGNPCRVIRSISIK